MSILTVADLKANSRHDPATQCWHWLRETCDGYPAMHTLCHRTLEKRTMVGTKGIWNIAHGLIPQGAIVYRLCGCRDCVQPAHMALAYTRAEVGRATRRSGHLKGTHLEVRRAAIALAHQAQQMLLVPDDVVRQIRTSTLSLTQLCEKLDLPRSTVCNIRSGRRRAGVALEVAA